MLIDRIYQKVKTYTNTDGRGNLSPIDFELLLFNAIQFRNEEYFYEINRLVNKENRGLASNSLENLPDKIREKIQFYLKESSISTVSESVFELPDDCRYIDFGELANNKELEFCKNRKEFNIAKNLTNLNYPVALKMEKTIKVAPDYTGSMNIAYLRTIKYPKWTYRIIGTSEVFDPSNTDFQDADIHSSEEDEIVRLVVISAGVNLDSEKVVGFGLGEKNSEFQQNNSN